MSRRSQGDVQDVSRSFYNCSLRPRFSVEEILSSPEVVQRTVSGGETLEVEIISHERNSFFVWPKSSELQRELFLAKFYLALTFLDRYCNSWNSTRVSVVPNIDSIYACKKETPNGFEWSRVKVLSVDSKQYSAKVYRQDYGMTSPGVPFSDFRPLPVDFITTKPLCIEVTFIETNPIVKTHDSLVLQFIDIDPATMKWRVRLGNSESSASKVTSPQPVIHSDTIQTDKYRQHSKAKNKFPKKNTSPNQNKQANRDQDLSWRPNGAENVEVSGDRCSGVTKAPRDDVAKNAESSPALSGKWGGNRGGAYRGRGNSVRKSGSQRDQAGYAVETPLLTKQDEPRYGTSRMESSKEFVELSRTRGKRVDNQAIKPANEQTPAGSKQVRYADTPLPHNQASRVVVVYAGDEGLFVVHESLLPEMEAIIKKIQEVSGGCPKTFPSVGKVCVAPFQGEWYRARVKQVDPQKFKCRVVFFDFGNEGDIDFSDVREFPEGVSTNVFTNEIILEDFRGPPPVECSVLNVIPLATTKDAALMVRVLDD